MTVQQILQFHQDQHYVTIANTCEKCYTNQRNNKTGYDRGGTATCIFSGHEWKELTLYFWKVCSDFASTLVGGVLDEGLTFRPVLIWSSARRILSHHLISITVPEAGLQECVHVCVWCTFQLEPMMAFAVMILHQLVWEIVSMTPCTYPSKCV